MAFGPKIQLPVRGPSGSLASNGGSPASRKRKPAARKRAAPSHQDLELRAQRDRLLEKFTIMQADLGGAFYEMAIRDHVRLDALTRKAAELQRVDVELEKLEEELQLRRSDSSGSCPNCDADYEPGARYCSTCGHELSEVDAA